MLKAVSFLLLLWCLTGVAIEKPPEADADAVPDGEIVSAEDDVYELDAMEVVGERRSLRQETRLRIIRQAMNEPRSKLKKDRDKLLCWLETPVGTHFQHVTCARNGDLEAVRTHGRAGQVGGMAGYGRHKFYRSIRADNPATMRKTLAAVPDSSYFDQDFVTIASAGGQPPRDVPEEKELDQFVNAWIASGELMKSGEPEEQVVATIEAEGLTLKRYNRLVELTKSYPSINARVTELVIEKQNPDSGNSVE